MHGGAVMAYLLSPRVLITLAIVAFLAFTHITAYKKGSAHVRLEWSAATAQALADARKLEQQRQRRADDAAAVAQLSAGHDRRSLAAARADADSLRGVLDGIERASRDSHEAATKHLAALRAVFDDCSRAYLDMAEAASSHSRDSLMYQNAWPKD
jgi:Tfp pilus assembly protein PilE